MTTDDVVDLLSTVRLLWPHSDVTGPVPERAVRLWHALLGDASVGEALAAVTELSTVEAHAPGAGRVAAKIAERRTPVPEWDEVWAEVRALARRCVTPRGYRVPRPEEFSHPLVAEYARAAWRDLCPGPERRHVTTFYAQQRDAYQALVGRTERDDRLRLVGAERPRLPSPRRVDFEAALPQLEAGDE